MSQCTICFLILNLITQFCKEKQITKLERTRDQLGGKLFWLILYLAKFKSYRLNSKKRENWKHIVKEK